MNKLFNIVHEQSIRGFVRFKSFAEEKIRCEKGAGMLEYLIIVAVVIIVAWPALQTIITENLTRVDNSWDFHIPRIFTTS